MNTVIDVIATITTTVCISTTIILGSDYPMLALPAIRIFSMLLRRCFKDEKKEELQYGIAMLVFILLLDIILLILMYTHITVLVWVLTDACYATSEVSLRTSEHYLDSSVQQIDPTLVSSERITISAS